MTWVLWNLTSFRLEIVLVSVQDECMVCARCTMGLQIVLDATDGTPRSRGSCGISLLSIWRQCWCRLGDWVMWNLTSFSLETVLESVQDGCMVCARYTIGLQIILDATDGTPR